MREATRAELTEHFAGLHWCLTSVLCAGHVNVQLSDNQNP